MLRNLVDRVSKQHEKKIMIANTDSKVIDNKMGVNLSKW